MFNLDSIIKAERFVMKDLKNKREFVLEIKNEKSVKVVRIMYPTSVGVAE